MTLIGALAKPRGLNAHRLCYNIDSKEVAGVQLGGERESRKGWVRGCTESICMWEKRRTLLCYRAFPPKVPSTNVIISTSHSALHVLRLGPMMCMNDNLRESHVLSDYSGKPGC